MKLLALIEFLRARLKTIIWIGYGVLGLLVVIDAFFIDKHHAHTSAEHLWGFWSIFGFVACTLIIFLSKWYGKAGIMTREDFYDE
jgi:hypothetical protein